MVRPVLGAEMVNPICGNCVSVSPDVESLSPFVLSADEVSHTVRKILNLKQVPLSSFSLSTISMSPP